VKRAFNILVNAENGDSARRAIALKITGEGAYAKATSLIGAIKLRHPKIAGMFHSDAGIRLQRRDADMAEMIMRRLVGLGIVVLPIHDSFITAARHEADLVEAMNVAWTQCFGGKEPLISVAYDVNDPQKEGRGVAMVAGGPVVPVGAAPLLLVRLPWGRSLDLFGGRNLPLRDLETWSSGRALLSSCLPP